MSDRHRKLNYDLCVALDLTKVGLAVDRLIANGLSSAREASYRAAAHALLTLLREENDRLLGTPSPSPATAEPTREGAPLKCGTFSADPIPADVRAHMDADRKAAEEEKGKDLSLPHYPPCPLGIICCLGSHESHARGECDVHGTGRSPASGGEGTT